MNSKIREHALQKVPFILVVGDKESETGEVNVRVRGQDKGEGSTLEAFATRLQRLIESRSTKLE
jgi:threonyl-tRNA synthetase